MAWRTTATTVVAVFALAFSGGAVANDNMVITTPHSGGGGGAISLAGAPAEIQQCLGTSGWFGWGMTTIVEELNSVGLNAAHFHNVLDLTLALSTEEGETLMSGQITFVANVVTELDPVTHTANFITPATVEMTGPAGVQRVTLLLHNAVRIDESGATIDASDGVWEYSDIVCGP